MNVEVMLKTQCMAMRQDVLSMELARARSWQEPLARGAGAARGMAPRQATRGIAVIRLYGGLTQRADLMSQFFGGTCLNDFTDSLRFALADESIGQVLIEIDSPGGSVYGTEEAARAVFQARQTKPIVAVANSLAASAAYWIGSQADEFFVTPGGEVGSIGVWMAHEDLSKALDGAGRKVTLISAGKNKVEGSPYEPLDPDAKRFMQSRCDDYYGAFTRDVARGRNVPVDQVRRGMGQGRVLGADAALAENMVDGVLTFEQVVQRMQRSGRIGKPAAAAQTQGVKTMSGQMARNLLALEEAGWGSQSKDLLNTGSKP